MSETNKKISEKVLSKISIKWGNRPCSMCGSVGKWEGAGSVVELGEYQPKGPVSSGGQNRITAVPVICTNCGNTVLVNPVVIGAMSGGGA